MNTKLIHGLVAGALIAKAFDLLPQIFNVSNGYDSNWWGSAIGLILPFIFGFGILLSGKPFVIPTLIFTALFTILPLYMIYAVSDPYGIVAPSYFPMAIFYALLSIALTILLRKSSSTERSLTSASSQ